jgi:calpain-7
VFINWNPSLFSHRTVLHQEWPVQQGPANDTYNLGYNPQYTLVVSYANVSKQAASVIHKTTANTPTVWVLLSRHVTTVETDDSSGDYLTMHLYDVQSEPVSNSRIYYPEVPLARGTVIIKLQLTKYYTHTTHAVVACCITK